MSKNISIENMQNRFPTISEFEKRINQLDPIDKPRKLSTIPQPKVPEYLQEAEYDCNPFKEIKQFRTDDLKKKDKERRELNIKKDLPTNEKVSRFTRIRFNASHKLKELKFNIDQEEMKEQNNIVKRKSLSRRRFTPVEDILITNKKIFLLNYAIKVKEEDIKNLDKVVENEEKSLKKLSDEIQNNKEIHLEHLKSVCKKTYDAVHLVDKETRRKDKIFRKVQRANYKLSKINSDCIRLEEEYSHLKSYKSFLVKCKDIQSKKQGLDRPSLIQELESTAILMDNLLNRFANSKISSCLDDFTDEDSTDKNVGYEGILNDNNDNTGLHVNNINIIKPNHGIFSKDQLNNLKATIFLGFNDSNINTETYSELLQSYVSGPKEEAKDSDTELNDNLGLNPKEKIPFDDPQELVNILTDLEINNLSLIENVQEQDETCEHMRQKIHQFINEIDSINYKIDIRMRNENMKIHDMIESIKWIKTKSDFIKRFNTLDRYNEIFYIKNLEIETLDELIDYMSKEIYQLYSVIFQNTDKEESKPNLLEMLKKIEMLVDSLYIEIQQYDVNLIHKAKKVIDVQKRKEFHLSQKKLDAEKNAIKRQVALDHSLMPPRYRFGKKLVYRSDPPKPTIKISNINHENIGKQEEINYFFT